MKSKPEEIDQWSYYDYKPAMTEHATTRLIPSWIPTEDRRRQLAYLLLSAYIKNNSRAWMPASVTEDEANARREYGDAATLVDSIVSSVLGEEQQILVEGAIDADPRIPAAEQQQAQLEEWADKERLYSKILEGERTAGELGDAVYALGWDEVKGRPRLRVYDPGFYFPVLEDDPDEYPTTIHLCWEFEREDPLDNQKKRRWLRRKTWQLVTYDEFVPKPWDPLSTQTCWYSDGEWLLEDIKEGGFYDLSPEAAVWNVEQQDTGLDFIPVIHLPNTVSEQEHFGTSSLARIVQILDDIISTDTDLQAASSTTGSPPLAITGTAIPTDDEGRIKTYGPGTVLETGDGNATMIDTSKSLTALMQYGEDLLSRLSINSRVPEALLGRVKPNEVPSGIALTLSFTPHANLVKEMRLVRKQKYSMMLKFVNRMYMLAQVTEEDIPVRLHLGSFLPADKQEASTIVTQLLRPDRPLISLDTALKMLIKAGFPIDDAVDEIERIKSEDMESANRLLDATGDPGLVYERLGLAPTIGGVLPGDATSAVAGVEEDDLPEGAAPPA